MGQRPYDLITSYVFETYDVYLQRAHQLAGCTILKGIDWALTPSRRMILQLSLLSVFRDSSQVHIVCLEDIRCGNSNMWE